MKGFKERERAFEAKFARENEIEFIVNMKACSILARDIAENKMGLDTRSTERYCAKILSLAVGNCSMEGLYDYITSRLSKNNVTLEEQELDLLYTKALCQARAEVI